MHRDLAAIAVFLLLIPACARREPRPVDIYPEDVCTLCKMAVTDQRFAAEIITPGGDALKFDDIGCLRSYRVLKPELEHAPAFYRDYASPRWLPDAGAVIVETGLSTPMGSGLAACADSLQAAVLSREHPPEDPGD